MEAFHVGISLAAFSIIFVILQFPSGALSDRIGRLMPIVFGLCLGIVSLVIIPLATDFPTLLANCAEAGLGGVELRTTHRHGVEPSLSGRQRAEVKKRFADSPVVWLGIGSNENFDSPDPAKLAKSIEATKAFIKLSHDVGGTGVKVKPNSFHKGVPREKTIEQIGTSLNTLGAYAADLGQQVRLEVHGQCSPLPIIKQIMDIARHPNVAVCWNCNAEDLIGEGLAHNFALVAGRLADTVHVRELDIGNYPYQDLMNLLVAAKYTGWVLLEARTRPKDRVAAMKAQRVVWEKMVDQASKTSTPAQPGGAGVNITKQPGKLRVEIGGKLFTEYCYQEVTKPYFYPVMAPTGKNITRHWPMKDGKGEQHDHVHHRSLWYAHGDVNGHDFWGEGKGHGKIVHAEFLPGQESNVIRSRNNWVAANGKTICTDRRTYTFAACEGGTVMDFEIALCASDGAVTFGDTKEGTMAIRVAPTLRVKGPVGKGHLVNSESVRDGAAWGKRATWCDYCGPIDGETVGVAIFDHPSNPRHPTWWHARDYGLLCANPFGVQYFESKPKGTGDLVIPAGETRTFRYRFYFHKGDEKHARVAEAYREFAAAKEAP